MLLAAAQVLTWLEQAYQALKQQQLVGGMSVHEFIEAAQLCGIQRHLKAISICPFASSRRQITLPDHSTHLAVCVECLHAAPPIS